MKIDKNYALELLKECEELYPERMTSYIDDEFNSKKCAHILYLYDNGLLIEYPPDSLCNVVSYRISSDGLDLLSGQSFLEWLESNHRP